jgi:hypothetical protein
MWAFLKIQSFKPENEQNAARATKYCDKIWIFRDASSRIARAYQKTNVHHTIGIVNPDYQPILIDSDVEYDSTVFDNAGVLEILFDCGRGCPIGLQRMPIPDKNRLHGITISRMVFPE